MLTGKEIIKDGHPTLRKRASIVPMPPSEEDQKILNEMHEFVRNSQDPEFEKKYGVRPGIGLAAPQINISKRMIAIYIEGDADKNGLTLRLFNPKIVSHSAEKCYLPGGEGCLSVEEVHKGFVPRFAKISVKGEKIDGTTFKGTFTGLEAICIQHEIDHLNGIMFFDHINKQDPFAPIENGCALVDEEAN